MSFRRFDSPISLLCQSLSFCFSLFLCIFFLLCLFYISLSVRPFVYFFLSLPVSFSLYVSLSFSVFMPVSLFLPFISISCPLCLCFVSIFFVLLSDFLYLAKFFHSVFFFFTFQPPYISSLYLIFMFLHFLCKCEFHYYLPNVQPFFSVNSGSWSVALHHLSVTVNYNYNEKYPRPDAERCFVSRRMLLMKHFNSRSFPCFILINNQSFIIIRKSK